MEPIGNRFSDCYQKTSSNLKEINMNFCVFRSPVKISDFEKQFITHHYENVKHIRIKEKDISKSNLSLYKLETPEEPVVKMNSISTSSDLSGNDSEDEFVRSNTCNNSTNNTLEMPKVKVDRNNSINILPENKLAVREDEFNISADNTLEMPEVKVVRRNSINILPENKLQVPENKLIIRSITLGALPENKPNMKGDTFVRIFEKRLGRLAREIDEHRIRNLKPIMPIGEGELDIPQIQTIHRRYAIPKPKRKNLPKKTPESGKRHNDTEIVNELVTRKYSDRMNNVRLKLFANRKKKKLLRLNSFGDITTIEDDLIGENDFENFFSDNDITSAEDDLFEENEYKKLDSDCDIARVQENFNQSYCNIKTELNYINSADVNDCGYNGTNSDYAQSIADSASVGSNSISCLIMDNHSMSQNTSSSPSYASIPEEVDGIADQRAIIKSKIMVQKEILKQTYKVLEFCDKNSMEELEAHRIQYVAILTRDKLSRDFDELSFNNSMNQAYYNGKVTLTNLVFYLDPAHINKSSDSPKKYTEYFFAVVTCNKVMSSSLATVKENKISFNKKFVLNNLSSNFNIEIAIYYKRLSNKKKQKSKSKLCKLVKSPKSCNLSRCDRVLNDSIESNEVKSYFSLWGEAIMTINDLKSHSLVLKNTSFSRLAPTVSFNARGEVYLTDTASCFIDIALDENHRNWNKRWCQLKEHKIIYWGSPTDSEIGNQPVGVIDIKKCVNSNVIILHRDQCRKKNSLLLRSCKRNYFLSFEDEQDFYSWRSMIDYIITSLQLWKGAL